MTRRRPQLLPLDDVRERLRPFAATYAGIRPIPVSRVVGTEGRGGDFDRSFRPTRTSAWARLREVERAFPAAGYPPIAVYALGDAYFVRDGHHRLAAARRRGAEWIDAEVTLLRARWHLSASADRLELLHAEQERLFLDRSGLGEASPEARIRFSRPSGYAELLEHVQLFAYRRLVADGARLAVADAAAEWYERAYLAAVDAVRRAGLAEACPHATDADRVLYLHQRRRELAVELGDLTLDDAARRVAGERSRSGRRPRVPGLRRHRTAGARAACG